MTETIRQQLMKAGFRETPLGMVERLFDKYSSMLAIAVRNGKYRTRNQAKIEEIRAKIEKICTERHIGNPLLGEVIEYKKEKKS